MIRKVWLMGVLSLAFPLVTSHIAAVDAAQEVSCFESFKGVVSIAPLTDVQWNNAKQAYTRFMGNSECDPTIPNCITALSQFTKKTVDKANNESVSSELFEYIKKLNDLHELITQDYQNVVTNTDSASAFQPVIQHIHDVKKVLRNLTANNRQMLQNEIAKRQALQSRSNNRSDIDDVSPDPYASISRITPLMYNVSDENSLFTEELKELNRATVTELEKALQDVIGVNHQKADSLLLALQDKKIKISDLKTRTNILTKAEQTALANAVKAVITSQDQIVVPPSTPEPKKEENKPQHPLRPQHTHPSRQSRGNKRTQRNKKQSFWSRFNIFGRRKASSQKKPQRAKRNFSGRMQRNAMPANHPGNRHTAPTNNTQAANKSTPANTTTNAPTPMVTLV